jgi:hypothetical protein
MSIQCPDSLKQGYEKEEYPWDMVIFVRRWPRGLVSGHF